MTVNEHAEKTVLIESHIEQRVEELCHYLRPDYRERLRQLNLTQLRKLATVVQVAAAGGQANALIGKALAEAEAVSVG